jgi:hypothetical protein
MIRIWRIEAPGAPEAGAAGKDPLLNGPARSGEGLAQSEIDDLIAIGTRDDIGWSEAAAAADGEIAGKVPADVAAGEAAIVPASPPAPPVAAPEAHAPPASAAPAPSRHSARLREAIEALSPAERMALFS